MERAETTSGDVLEFLAFMDELRIRIWLDGGWAVDACLGTQTRTHRDLDIVIEVQHAQVAVAALNDRGYGPVSRDDTRPWNFVLGDAGRHEVDFHLIVLDENGNGIYGPAESPEFFFPAASLRGTGSIGDRRVECISPEWLVEFHTGYDVDEDDWADVSALCERFAIPVPEDYRSFQKTTSGAKVAETRSDAGRASPPATP